MTRKNQQTNESLTVWPSGVSVIQGKVFQYSSTDYNINSSQLLAIILFPKVKNSEKWITSIIKYSSKVTSEKQTQDRIKPDLLLTFITANQWLLPA